MTFTSSKYFWNAGLLCQIRSELSAALNCFTLLTAKACAVFSVMLFICYSGIIFPELCCSIFSAVLLFSLKATQVAFTDIQKILEEPVVPKYCEIYLLFFLIGCSTDAKQAEEQSAAASEELYPFCREPSYFEIPTKEFQQTSQVAESAIHEIPTKDTQSSHAASAGHASFTIEFDDNTPGKVTIKDHVTKFTSEQRHKSKKPSSSSGQDLPGLQTVMMAAESKVADWLAQNNPPRMIWDPTEEDSKSIKSDVPVYLKRLKGNVNNSSFAYF